jgi:NAD(P)-dependent dehydrogenase (short-subunit alcohol dehydrogenase family)
LPILANPSSIVLTTSITALVSQIPLGRRGEPEEIAEAIVFLASDEGASTVGSEFVI